ncbi:MAG: chemotaxis protein CheW [Anaerolineae bacterium]|nr:chemotaxis protein CheW [Anaerolineae bacterium]
MSKRPPSATVEARLTPSMSGEGYFVVFRLERQLYALPLENVRRAVRMAALTSLPDAPPWSAGLLNLGGEALPVLDLRARFGLATRPPHPDDRLLVVETGIGRFLLWVDAVLEVTAPARHEIQPPPTALTASRPLLGSFRRGHSLVLALDAARLLPVSQQEEG